ncbi:MAG: ABC transporter substrate-binding protein [Chloroflexota bacterium]
MSKKAIRLLVLAVAFAALAFPTFAQDMEFVFPIGEGDFNWESYETFASENDLTGQELTIFGPWLGRDQELVESVIAYFEEATGADVTYTGSDSFEQQIVIDIEGGSPPNVAVFPQPGLTADLAAQGDIVPLSDDDASWVAENYAAGESWVNLGTYADENGEDQFYGFFYKVDVKSLVWYVPDEFEDAGYEIPETMEDLLALSEQMVADGNTPWCIGLGSGDATGWPATDWIEDIMLRTASPETYDAWVANEIPFNDEAVVNAINTFGQFVFTDGWVNGGPGAVASTDFRQSPLGLFEVPPECFMHRQASFIPGFFPDDVDVAAGDADFFYFPPFAGEDLGNPVLGAGTLFAITADSPAARAWIDFMKTPIAHEVWMAQQGFLTPFTGVNTDLYSSDTLRRQGDILLNATTFRFDGSDLMPGAIGAGAFWTGMVDYVNSDGSPEAAQEVADAIEETWANLDN